MSLNPQYVFLRLLIAYLRQETDVDVVAKPKVNLFAMVR